MSFNQPYDEKKLLSQISGGNTGAFQELVRMYKDKVFTAAFRIIRDRERAEDSVQDIFMKVWVHRENLHSIENFGGWLHTVTHNTLISALKRLARESLEVLPSEMYLPAKERTIEDLLAQKEYAELLKNAVDSLSDRQRQVFQLVKEDGLSREEAARRLDISLDTVKFHLAEAARKIRAYVLKNGDMALLILLIVKNY